MAKHPVKNLKLLLTLSNLGKIMNRPHYTGNRSIVVPQRRKNSPNEALSFTRSGLSFEFQNN